MAPVRYSKTIPDTERVMTEIAKTRSVLIGVGTKVRPFVPAHHMLTVVVTGIDALATYITGERHDFARRYDEGALEHARPGLDLDESPHVTREELAFYRREDQPS